MKKAFITVGLGIFLVMTVGSVYVLERFQNDTELQLYGPTRGCSILK